MVGCMSLQILFGILYQSLDRKNQNGSVHFLGAPREGSRMLCVPEGVSASSVIKKAAGQTTLQNAPSDSPLAASDELIGAPAALEGMKQRFKVLRTTQESTALKGKSQGALVL